MKHSLFALVCFFVSVSAFGAGRDFEMKGSQADAFTAQLVKIYPQAWVPAASVGNVINLKSLTCSSGMISICTLFFINEAGQEVQKSGTVEALRPALRGGGVTVEMTMGRQALIENVVCHRVNRKTTCKGVDRLAR